MKNNTLIHLQDLNPFEMFKIPSIGLTGTLLDCNVSSAKVIYHNMQISDKMGNNVAKKEVTELISPNTEVIRSGETNDKLRKRFKIKETKNINSVDARTQRDSVKSENR